MSSTPWGVLVMNNATNATTGECNTPQLPSAIANGTVVTSLLVDVSGDGIVDVVALLTTGVVVVARAAATGVYTAGVVTLSPTGGPFISILALDVNVDGAVDVFAVGSTVGDSVVFLYNSSATFTPLPLATVVLDSTHALSGATIVSALAFDGDGDALVDVLLLTATAAVFLSARHPAVGVVQYAVVGTAPGGAGLIGVRGGVAGDVDNDGDVDVVVWQSGSGVGGPTPTLLNNGAGVFRCAVCCARCAVPCNANECGGAVNWK